MAVLGALWTRLARPDDYEPTPGLILKDEPLEVVLALLRNSGQRLEAGKTKLEYIEGEGRPQRKKLLDASTRIATIIPT